MGQGRGTAEDHIRPRPGQGSRQRRRGRLTGMGMIFQSFELLDYLDVRDNILLPAYVNATLPMTAALYASTSAMSRDRQGSSRARFPRISAEGTATPAQDDAIVNEERGRGGPCNVMDLTKGNLLNVHCLELMRDAPTGSAWFEPPGIFIEQGLKPVVLTVDPSSAISKSWWTLSSYIQTGLESLSSSKSAACSESTKRFPPSKSCTLLK